MKKIQITAKNVQKAIEEGLKELNATQDQVEIKIIDEGGLFKKAKVELILDKEVEEALNKKQAEIVEEEKTAPEVKAEKIQKAEDKKVDKKAEAEEKIENKKSSPKTEKDAILFGTEFLTELCKKMNVEAEISAVELDGGVTFNASGDKVSTLIGKRGETLNAIQDVLANVMKNAGYRDVKFYFDVENYKNRREMSLINLAERMAKKAIKIEKPIKLERMNAYERKIIHTALQDFEGITTKSEGEEPYRYLVVIPTKKD